MKPVLGLLTWVDLGGRLPPGHEQEGRRPCVVVAAPTIVQRLRFPMVVVAPMTTAVLPSTPLYPRLSQGSGGLAVDGTVLLDQVVSVDVRRMKKHIGQLPPSSYQPIRDGLRRMFQL